MQSDHDRIKIKYYFQRTIKKKPVNKGKVYKNFPPQINIASQQTTDNHLPCKLPLIADFRCCKLPIKQWKRGFDTPYHPINIQSVSPIQPTHRQTRPNRTEPTNHSHLFKTASLCIAANNNNITNANVLFSCLFIFSEGYETIQLSGENVNPGQLKLGPQDFELKKVLGRGGYGKVFQVSFFLPSHTVQHSRSSIKQLGMFCLWAGEREEFPLITICYN